MNGPTDSLRVHATLGCTRPFSIAALSRTSLMGLTKPSRVMMLIVPAIARAPVSAVGARWISMRSICSGLSESIENPDETRSPSSRICV